MIWLLFQGMVLLHAALRSRSAPNEPLNSSPGLRIPLKDSPSMVTDLERRRYQGLNRARSRHEQTLITARSPVSVGVVVEMSGPPVWHSGGPGIGTRTAPGCAPLGAWPPICVRGVVR